MSSKLTLEQKKQINRKEVKVFIIRHFKDQKEFCKKKNINYNTFRKWIQGDDTQVKVINQLIQAIQSENYPIKNIINPGTRLDIEATAS